jgi:hypothetical protein
VPFTSEILLQVRPGIYLEHLVIRGSVNLIACGLIIIIRRLVFNQLKNVSDEVKGETSGSTATPPESPKHRSVIIKSQRHTTVLCVGSSCTATFRGFEFQSDAIDSKRDQRLCLG